MEINILTPAQLRNVQGLDDVLVNLLRFVLARLEELLWWSAMFKTLGDQYLSHAIHVTTSVSGHVPQCSGKLRDLVDWSISARKILVTSCHFWPLQHSYCDVSFVIQNMF